MLSYIDYNNKKFVVEDINEGEMFTENNVRSIRPGFGLETKYIKDIFGKKAKCNIKKGTPMIWGLVK